MLKKAAHLIGVLAALVLATAILAACGQSTPAPAATAAKPAAAPTTAAAPTKAPAAATVAPTKAPAAAPTAAPKASFPEKGKTVTMIIPFAAGGGSDVQARILAPELEKIMGVSISIVNKPGAGSQVGVTELAKSKPDGYTIGSTNTPSAFMAYLDPARQAAFGRKDLQPVANVAVDPSAVVVKADGPYKTLKDLIDAAKAKPEGVKAGTGGIMGSQHIATVLFEKATGVTMAPVHFEGGGPALTALLGEHIDVTMGQVGEVLPQVKSGNVRVLGVMTKEPSKFLPNVPTLESLGYKAYGDSSRGYSLPGGTPAEIVKAWEEAIKKAAQAESFVKNIEDQGIALAFMGTTEYEKYWADYEEVIKPLMPDLKKQ